MLTNNTQWIKCLALRPQLPRLASKSATGRVGALLLALLLSSLSALAQTNQFVPHDDANQVPANTTKSGNVLLNDDNPQNLANSAFAVTLVANVTHGTLTLNANGSYTYTPTANYVGSDSFTYKICQPGATPTCTVATATVNLNIYDSSVVCTLGTGPNLLSNPSFTAGNKRFTSSYTYVPTPTSVPDLYAEGTYAVTGNSNTYHTGFYVTGRTGTTDLFMAVNGAASLGIVYSQTVTVQPNTYYYLSVYAASANSSSPAQLGLVVDGKSTSVVTTLPTTANQYVQFSDVYFSGPGTAGGFPVTFEIRDINKAAGGNDFGIDDLYFGSCSTSLLAETKTTTAVSNSPVPNNIQPLSATISNGGSVGITVASFTILSLPATGVLSYNGVPVTIGQVIPVSSTGALTSGGVLTYTPAPGCLTYSASFTYNATDTGGTTSSNTATYTIPVQPVPVLAGSIGSDQTICAGTTPAPLTSTTAASGGSGTYAYQWESSPNNSTWSAIVGAIGATYAPGALTATTYYRRTVTSGVCASDISNVVTITVQPVIVPGTIAADQTICAGATPAPLTSTTAASGGSGTYAYQWESSPNNSTWTAIAGATGATYSPGALTTTTYYRRTVAAGVCAPASTSVVTITVLPTTTPGSIGSDQTICAGATPAPLTSTTGASGGSGTYTYQWESSPDGITWTPIASATGATYSPGAITVTTYYRRQVVAGTCTAPPTNVVTITVQPATLTPGAIAADQTICAGSTPAPLTETTAASGSGTYTYQWESSPDNVTWTSITGATGTTYAPGALSVTTYYRRRVVLGSCATYVTNVVTITVQPVIVPGTIGSDQTICAGGTPAALTSPAGASGGSGNYTYQWESSPDNVTWTSIAGATGATYSPGALSATTYYRRTVTAGVCAPATTNVVTITVQPAITPGTVAADQTICAGSTPAPLTSTTGASGGTGTYAYQWDSSPDNVTWTPIAGATGTTYAPGALSVTTYYRRRLTSGTCAAATTNVVAITVQPIIGPGTIGSDQTICAGATPAPLTSTTAASGGSGNYAYQWESSPNNSTWTSIAGAVGPTYSPGALTATTYYRRTVAAGVCAPAVSNVVTVQTQALVTTTVQLATPPAQCAGLAFTLTPVVAGTGTAPTYQWFVNNVPVATTPTYSSTTLADGDQVKVVVTPTAGLCTSGAATATVTISLTPVALPVLTISSLTALPVCIGTPITLTLATVTNAGASPQYQWQVDGVDVAGATGTTFTSATLRDGQAVTLTLRTATVCAPVVVKSNAIRAGITQPVTVSAGPDLQITEGESIPLEGQTTGSHPTWTPRQSLTFIAGDTLHPQAAPLVTTVYTLSAGTGACTGQSSVTVTVTPRLRIPSAFTPNGDGNDDTWEIDHIGEYLNNHVTIFNRWGNKLFDTANYGRGNEWNGTIKGSPAPIGTYYFLIVLPNGKHYTGPLTIIY